MTIGFTSPYYEFYIKNNADELIKIVPQLLVGKSYTFKTYTGHDFSGGSHPFRLTVGSTEYNLAVDGDSFTGTIPDETEFTYKCITPGHDVMTGTLKSTKGYTVSLEGIDLFDNEEHRITVSYLSGTSAINVSCDRKSTSISITHDLSTGTGKPGVLFGVLPDDISGRPGKFDGSIKDFRILRKEAIDYAQHLLIHNAYATTPFVTTTIVPGDYFVHEIIHQLEREMGVDASFDGIGIVFEEVNEPREVKVQVVDKTNEGKIMGTDARIFNTESKMLSVNDKVLPFIPEWFIESEIFLSFFTHTIS